MGRYVLDPRQLHGPSPSRHVDAWEDPQAGAAHGWGNIAETATWCSKSLSYRRRLFERPESINVAAHQMDDRAV